MSVSVRVIDCVYGKPAVGVWMDCTREFEGALAQRWRDQTDEGGRVSLSPERIVKRGSYTFTFDLDDYFRKLGYSPLNSAISIRLHMDSDARHYGLALLVTPSSCVAFRED